MWLKFMVLDMHCVFFESNFVYLAIRQAISKALVAYYQKCKLNITVHIRDVAREN